MVWYYLSMKKIIIGLLVLILLVAAYFYQESKKSENIQNNGEDIQTDGFGLYFHHNAIGKSGREILFSISSKKARENSYDLKFRYDVIANNINIRLESEVDKGKCPMVPMGGPIPMCTPEGDFTIPESLLPTGVYNFNFIANGDTAKGQLVVEEDRIDLELPKNNLLTYNLQEIYPLPRNILFGSVNYQDPYTTQFLEAMEKAGFQSTKIPVHKYRNGPVLNEDGSAKDYNGGLTFIFTLNNNYDKAKEIAKKYYFESNKKLRVILYSTEGQEETRCDSSGEYNCI